MAWLRAGGALDPRQTRWREAQTKAVPWEQLLDAPVLSPIVHLRGALTQSHPAQSEWRGRFEALCRRYPIDGHLRHLYDLPAALGAAPEVLSFGALAAWSRQVA